MVIATARPGMSSVKVGVVEKEDRRASMATPSEPESVAEKKE